ncbi:poly(3-hydroxybutyrate) depolymerase [Siphonobacter sp. SORGH_AS_0500]|uniref:alpha/beta hydrolase family esterase n=1 Tax=Siphonobacter sp. SORGH_AS_0500 TaxID=1864824 RepID=UPI000CB639DC|nr:alpha/beta hydrolase-fold protein [Siphonobacter sp. SORGH_AS_0500]PKK37160.1 poly(3-hydroxybutyrate) depolymerase [Siphonobacter sp. SORGH_AS_0500]
MFSRFSLFCFFTLVSWQSLRAQVMSDSLQIEGNYRTFYFNKPAATEKPQNLVFVMHGSGGNGRDMMRSTEAMEKEAKASHTLVVYPSGYKRYWNECRKASPALANKEDVNEQAFFAGMIDYFQKKYGVNPKRVFAVGTSGGGHMAYKLALTMPEQFRAVTAIIANLPDTDNMDCVPAGKAVPIMIINGTEDNVNPYQGGVVDLGPTMNMGRVRSTERSLAYWADLAGYQGKPKLEKLPDTDPNDGRTIEKYSYQARNKPDVILLKVIGGKHDYPHDIDVHVEALRFFLRQN